MLSPAPAFLRIVKRWIAFNSVGAVGILVQLGVLSLLVSKYEIHYLTAVAIAVEAALLHNFLWHENWTWADRTRNSPGGIWRRLLCFHLANGGVSLAGNVLLMKTFVDFLNWNFIYANLASIASCSILNYFAGDLFVYRAGKPSEITGGKMTKNCLRTLSPVVLAAALALSGSPFSEAAELSSETLKAWSEHVAAAEKRINAEIASGEKFLSMDFRSPLKAARERRALLAGDILIENVEAHSGAARKVPDGKIHHWRGLVFIPAASLDAVLFRVENPTAEDMKQEDVVDSKVLEKSPGRLRLYLKLQRRKVVAATYSTEHLVRYSKCSDSRAWSSSVATRIRELETIEGKEQREKPEGRDSGFLWKMNSYWRYQQVEGGVMVECESMTLSRSVPAVLIPIAGPLIKSVARESMHRTLHSLRARMTRGGAGGNGQGSPVHGTARPIFSASLMAAFVVVGSINEKATRLPTETAISRVAIMA